jgi:hypothetical protein
LPQWPEINQTSEIEQLAMAATMFPVFVDELFCDFTQSLFLNETPYSNRFSGTRCINNVPILFEETFIDDPGYLGQPGQEVFPGTCCYYRVEPAGV